jgi:ribosomal-protein-serine acetyltransferase
MLEVSENIKLDPLSLSYTTDVFNALDKDRDILRQWLPFVDFTKEENDSKSFIETTITSADKTFVILYKEQFAGLIGIKDIDNLSRKGEMGYWISPEFQNKGIVTLSAKRLIEYAFCDLNLNRLQINAAVGNAQSNRVAQKLNFKHEGIIRDGVLLDSGYSDMNMYSLLKRETLWK